MLLVYVLFQVFCFYGAEGQIRALHILGKYPITELHPSPYFRQITGHQNKKDLHTATLLARNKQEVSFRSITPTFKV
jgi:hypothetical protein